MSIGDGPRSSMEVLRCELSNEHGPHVWNRTENLGGGSVAFGPRWCPGVQPIPDASFMRWTDGKRDYCCEAGAAAYPQPCPHHGDQEEGKEPTKALARWADPAMFTAEPSDASAGPRVYLLWMTPDPLGAIAAACKIYKGEVVRSLADVTDEERREFFAQVQRTKLKAPFEFVKFHLLLEGVTRAFTHQMVRQRTAVYAQESLRFAVKEDAASAVALPPSLAGTESTHVCPTCYGEGRVQRPGWNCGCGPSVSLGLDCGLPAPFDKCNDPWHSESDPAQAQRRLWDETVRQMSEAYNRLVNMGMPAEDARGLLPHNITTRLHYATDLRALLDHAGNRLCTQAQFEWRLVFARIVEAIREYQNNDYNCYTLSNGDCVGTGLCIHSSSRWQFDMLSQLFRPVCYQTGRCEFKANFDRACSIRDRVDANEEIGRPSSEWGEEHDAVTGNPIVAGVGSQSVVRDGDNRPVFIGGIRQEEWLLDPDAAR